jgi:hypothetical protein
LRMSACTQRLPCDDKAPNSMLREFTAHLAPFYRGKTDARSSLL